MAKTVLNVDAPEKKANGNNDKNCPFYGQLNVKKANLVGTVIKKDAHGTATIEWVRSKFVPKYERFQYRRSRVRVHNPASINAAVGEKVLLARTRPISKTKHHVIIKIISEDKSLDNS